MNNLTSIIKQPDKISFFKNEEKIEALNRVEVKDFELNTIIKGNKVII